MRLSTLLLSTLVVATGGIAAWTLQRHADAAPFLRPVPAADVPDYYTVIIVSAAEE